MPPTINCISIYRVCPAGNESSITAKEGGRQKGREGRESLLKWNLVTDASEGGAALQGRVEVVRYAFVCVEARACANACVRACACTRTALVCAARAGKGQDMSAH